MIDLAEFIPNGGSIMKLIAISKKFDIAILAGLFEKDENDNLFNTYVCVNKDGLVAKHRKLHPFINQFLKAGDNYTVFELNGWKCGILICYDNNIIENVRATTLLGANIIFMPHVTMCTPSTRPGAGFVDPVLWQNRKADPLSLWLQFDGKKGRDWLMKWLPARAYDNAIYAVFSNPIGMDGDQLKNGCSMIIDPFGEILVECRSFDDSYVTALITPEKNIQAGGHRYIKARRPELYQNIISQDHKSEQVVIWLNIENKL
jgi:predicted amidohydrolase